MKKLLVITFYWPPSGGSGVQRWLKFCKYLRDFGWEPIVYTPENPDVDLVDTTLEVDVPPGLEIIRTPIMDPRRLLRGSRATSKTRGDGTDRAGLDQLLLRDRNEWSLKQKILVWIRTNLFIPDARRLWVRPSIRFLSDYLARNPVDAIASTGPPQSMHLIAAGLRSRFAIPWLADFRDPWTGIAHFDQIPLTRAARRKHYELQRHVLTTADAVVSVSNSISRDLEQLGATNIHTITNGYDEEDLPDREGSVSTPDSGFVISYVGFLSPERAKVALWQAVAELMDEDEGFAGDVRICLVGQVDPAFIERAHEHGIADRIELVGYVPHHEAIAHMRRSHLLLLIIPEKDPGSITGKLFEYMAAQQPILFLGPAEGDAAEIIENTGAGLTVRPNDPAAIKSALSGLYERYKKGAPPPQTEGVEQFSRRSLTRRLASVLDQIAERDQIAGKGG